MTDSEHTPAFIAAMMEHIEAVSRQVTVIRITLAYMARHDVGKIQQSDLLELYAAACEASRLLELEELCGESAGTSEVANP